MNIIRAGKRPVTCTAAPVSTLSPHTEDPYAREALVAALTASVAWPHPGSQNEWRLTPGAGKALPWLCRLSLPRLSGWRSPARLRLARTARSTGTILNGPRLSRQVLAVRVNDAGPDRLNRSPPVDLRAVL